MAHRSVSPSDVDLDPFWAEASRQRPPLLQRVTTLARPLGSWSVVVLGVAGVAVVGWGLLRPSAPPVESALPVASASAGPAGAAPAGAAPAAGAGGAASTSTTEAAPLVVQAAGAVAEPGVYELAPGARVDDLVEAAGGLTARADPDRVNLAAPVADGERVWVPSEGEEAVPDVVAGVGGGASAPGGPGGGGTGADGGGSALPAAPVDLNTATAEQLDALPGVGPATATAILAYRDEHGRFASVEELLDVRGIGDAKLEQLRPLVRV